MELLNKLENFKVAQVASMLAFRIAANVSPHFLVHQTRLLKLLCATSCYHPVQTQITDPNILMLFPYRLFMTARGNSCPSMRPTLLSETHFGDALSCHFEVVVFVVAHM